MKMNPRTVQELSAPAPDPALLAHPNIPKPLHGTAPREVMGRDWWDVERRRAYQRAQHHCMACGRHTDQDEWRPGPEAHESYLIDYRSGTVAYRETVCLCHSCHNFIHSGRLLILTLKGEMDGRKAVAILRRGAAILKKAGLAAFWGTGVVWAELIGGSMPCGIGEPPGEEADWKDWKLRVHGQEFHGKFSTFEEWMRFYRS